MSDHNQFPRWYRSISDLMANGSAYTDWCMPAMDRDDATPHTVSICDCGEFMVPTELHEAVVPTQCPICKTERKLRWIYPASKRPVPITSSPVITPIPIDTEGTKTSIGEFLDRLAQVKVRYADDKDLVDAIERIQIQCAAHMDRIAIDSVPVECPLREWSVDRARQLKIAQDAYLKQSGFFGTEPGGNVLHALIYWLHDIDEATYRQYQRDPKPYPDSEEFAKDNEMCGLYKVRELYPPDSFVHNWLLEQIERRRVEITMQTVRNRVLQYCAQFQPITSLKHYEEMHDADWAALHEATLRTKLGLVNDVIARYLGTFESWLMNCQPDRYNSARILQDDGSLQLFPIFNEPFLPLDIDSAVFLPEIENELAHLRVTQRIFDERFVYQWIKMAIECWEKQKSYLEKSKPIEEVKECPEKN